MVVFKSVQEVKGPVSLKVFSRGEDGVQHELRSSSALGATVEFDPPGTPVSEQTEIRIEHTISSKITSDEPIFINDLVGGFTKKDGSSGDNRYDLSLVGATQTFLLNPGNSFIDSGTWFDIEDLGNSCDVSPYCTFTLHINGSSALSNFTEQGSGVIKITSAGLVALFEQPNIPFLANCGDGIKEGNEECDTYDFGGATCQSLQHINGTLSCTSSCLYNEVACFG